VTIVQRNFEYEPTGMGIIKFHSWLMRHDKIQNFPYKVWGILYSGLCLAEEIHWTDARKNDRRPYIHHQIEIVIDYITKYPEEKISSSDILVLILHDAMEDHPECWMIILERFGLQIFRDVLVLSTG
jgi:(p)ppGpp synthase/HD superfamily hydrolase